MIGIKPIQIAQKYIEVAEKGNKEEIMNLYDNDGVLIDFEGNKHEGKSEIIKFYNRPLPPNFKLEILDIKEMDNYRVEAVVKATWNGQETPQVLKEVVTLKNGKVKEFQMNLI